MKETEMQQWIQDFYKQRGWSNYGPFERIAFLTEEVGETARAVRAIEIGRDRPDEAVQSADKLKQELTEELGDILGNVFILASMYDVTIGEILEAHKDKLSKRYIKE
ncbi:MazG nucleotide pyrophosphohydrolase domain-containing protein [Paenibacillus lupini]|uniref:MazG nucleotide pyrophosphohydrolase domain-containing protein n=1 Tax=Paenibacillus TaxID=44249 RepID=UPI00141E58E6|nr:MazG-like family protein [Paenibacillus lupini]NIK26096.1 NTP pyrophosphatase (non-canonical NTP hydrolase) [Paenibacillus lupini]